MDDEDDGDTPEIEVSMDDLEECEPAPFGAPSDPAFDATKIRCGECGAVVIHDAGSCKPTAIRMMNAAGVYLGSIMRVVDDGGAPRPITRAEAQEHALAILRTAGILL